ncbi:hypothetical protein L2E82_25186 [Cichorium intybus]|uniref:Uncharacterized protein n=1 Tax=Cichorium intybus TaxID=13427 RepID=A0ACB9E349_CICIN|nr:hypothetical protein L2E82_25186 [Cichorium intybus]
MFSLTIVEVRPARPPLSPTTATQTSTDGARDAVCGENDEGEPRWCGGAGLAVAADEQRDEYLVLASPNNVIFVGF